MKQLRMNNISSIKPEDIKINKGENARIVTIEYEPRGNLIANLDYIVKFKHAARIRQR
jgi:hypothetical protein